MLVKLHVFSQTVSPGKGLGAHLAAEWLFARMPPNVFCQIALPSESLWA